MSRFLSPGRQISTLAALFTALLLVLLFVPRTAFTQARATGPTTGSSLSLDVSQARDTARFIGRWRRLCDAAGCDDSARVAWTVNGNALPPRVVRPGLGWVWMADTIQPLRAVCPAPTTATLALTIYRRTQSQTATRTRTMGCRDVPLPPIDSFVIDTGNVWRTARRVDSLPRPATDVKATLFEVLRADSSRAMVHVVRAAKPPHDVRGAVVRAPTRCPDGMWWHTGDTTSVRLAQARAAQWPTDTLTARVTSAWLAADYSTCDYCRVWQARCG